MRLEGKTALITGGLRGIGRATAERFLAEKAKVFITDIDSPENARKELGSSNLIYIQSDVSIENDWEKLTAEISKQGGLDCLVNNAGTDCTGAVQDITAEAWRRIMSVNVDSRINHH